MKKFNAIGLLTLLIMFFSIGIFAQEKIQLNFFADTINVSPDNRILKIEQESTLGDTACCYIFHCNCVAHNEVNYKPIFCFFKKSGDKTTKIFLSKPDIRYSSWKELSAIISKEKYNFDKKYDLYITEVLPHNKYQTNKVRMTLHHEPIIDRVKDLLPKQ